MMAGSNGPERGELDSVLESGIFAKASRQALLLRHICEETFHGRADQLKEYALATDVLGRPAHFDQNHDAIVRVEFHRLRKRLKEYYEGEGAGHALHIVIDPGQYVPRFVPRGAKPVPENGAHAEKNGATASELASAANTPTPAAPVNAWPARFHLFWVLAVAGVLLCGLIAALALRTPRHNAAEGSAGPSRAADPIRTSAPQDSVRILCGASKDKYIDRAGNVWMGDRYFSGGEASSQPLQLLARAPDLALYQNFRFGDFTYDIPLKPGSYELHLFFAETHYGPGALSGGGETSRMFDVWMNGKPLLHLFDIIKDAGGNYIGDERVFKDVTPAADGYLHLGFKRLLDSPILDAIAIEPAPPGRINPIRILAQNNSYTDRAGNIWSPDRYFRGGQLALHLTRGPVSGTADPGLYSSERFGNFTYAIPVAPGKYQVTLRFAETYWGIQNAFPNQPDQNGSPTGGVGSRSFDVYCNGVALLRNFDVFKEAGGALLARDKTFNNLEPDAQGKLNLSFVPVRDYALINAIEVTETAP